MHRPHNISREHVIKMNALAKNFINGDRLALSACVELWLRAHGSRWCKKGGCEDVSGTIEAESVGRVTPSYCFLLPFLVNLSLVAE